MWRISFATGLARQALLADGEIKLMTAEECTVQSARTRSKSPKKRLRSDLATSEVLSTGSQDQELQEIVHPACVTSHYHKRRKIISSPSSSTSSKASDSELPELYFDKTDTEASFELQEDKAKVLDWVNTVTTAPTEWTAEKSAVMEEAFVWCSESDATTSASQLR